MCSIGFASAASQKSLSDYTNPPSTIVKDAEWMIGAEYTAIDMDDGDAVPDHLYGFRVDWRRNFAVKERSFWNAGFSLGYASGSEDGVDVTNLTMNLGADFNALVGRSTYFFVGARIGMNQMETKLEGGGSWLDNKMQMGFGIGIKHYFPNSSNCLTVGLQRMLIETNGNSVSTTTIYAGYSFAF